MKLNNKQKSIIFFFFVAVALVFFFYRKPFLAFAQSIIDSFTDTSKIADTWNVQVDTSAGKVKLAERTCDSSVWICSASTTCSNTLGDGDYIIVASTSLASTKQWKTANTACDMPECSQNGGQDGDQLVADNTVNFADYPARDACKALGGRLPTITELQCIYNHRSDFNDDFGTDYFWSAAEGSETGARRLNFDAGVIDGAYKSLSYRVRCVLGW